MVATIADKRGKLAEEPFDYRELKGDRVHLLYRGKTVETLTGKQAIRFLQRTENTTPAELQLLLAKATKNFKHGNEKQGKT